MVDIRPRNCVPNLVHPDHPGPTDPCVRRPTVHEGGSASRHHLPLAGRGWGQRLWVWIVGLLCGVLCLAFLIWFGIPLTAGIVWIRSAWLGKEAYGAPAKDVYLFAQIIFILIGVGSFFVLRLAWLYKRISPGAAVAALFWLLIHAYAFYRMFDGSDEYKLVLVATLIVVILLTNGSMYKLTIPGLEDWYSSPERSPKNVADNDSARGGPNGPVPTAADGIQSNPRRCEPGRATDVPPGGGDSSGCFPGPRLRPRSGTSHRPRRRCESPSRIRHCRARRRRRPSGRRPPSGHDLILDRWRERVGSSHSPPKLAIVCVSGGALRSGIW